VIDHELSSDAPAVLEDAGAACESVALMALIGGNDAPSPLLNMPKIADLWSFLGSHGIASDDVRARFSSASGDDPEIVLQYNSRELAARTEIDRSNMDEVLSEMESNFYKNFGFKIEFEALTLKQWTRPAGEGG
jgi:hypothetical protein